MKLATSLPPIADSVLHCQQGGKRLSSHASPGFITLSQLLSGLDGPAPIRVRVIRVEGRPASDHPEPASAPPPLLLLQDDSKQKSVEMYLHTSLYPFCFGSKPYSQVGLGLEACKEQDASLCLASQTVCTAATAKPVACRWESCAHWRLPRAPCTQDHQPANQAAAQRAAGAGVGKPGGRCRCLPAPEDLQPGRGTYTLLSINQARALSIAAPCRKASVANPIGYGCRCCR